MVHLFSPGGKYDSLYMRNYATLKVKDELARLPGVGQIQIFGSGEYAMRVWLTARVRRRCTCSKRAYWCSGVCYGMQTYGDAAGRPRRRL